MFFVTATNANSNNDIQQISNVIQKYFDGTQQGKPELVKEAFLPSLEVQWLGDNGELKRRDANSYINNIKPNKFVPRYGKIINIDVTHTAASAKVEITWNNRMITDYVLLLKTNGTWNISNKIATWPPKR
jgi:hypothetical protein